VLNIGVDTETRTEFRTSFQIASLSGFNINENKKETGCNVLETKTS
jgi:hypothetical protein